ncbi:MAG TPA: hypothetical protein VIS31_11345 [Woeseiaceae bacterium]|jgi:ElaB/YqjD/DUF883 family membrane-anchored ribosome-binding protein
MTEFDELIDDVKQKRDEIRVQIDLASKEAKEEWEELEEKMEKFLTKTQLRKTGEGVSDAVGQLGRELKLGYQRLWRAMADD